MYEKYRKLIYMSKECASDICHDSTEVLVANDIETMIGEIEYRVNEILSDVEKISGLTEIDEIAMKLKSLSKDLY